MVKFGKTESSMDECSLVSSTLSSNSSVSSSDSEYYSPEEIVGKNAKNCKVRRSPKVKHSRVSKLSFIGGSASTSNSEIDAIEKNQKLEAVVLDLTSEKQQMLQTVIHEMKDVFGDGKDLSEEVDFFSLVKELKKEALTVKFQLDAESKEMKECIQEYKENMSQLRYENGVLRARIDELENLPRPSVVVDEKGTEGLQTRIEKMVTQVQDLQYKNETLVEEIISLKTVKEELESKIEKLVMEVGDLEDRNKELVNKTISLEETNHAIYNLESNVEEQVAQVARLQNQNKRLEEETALSKMERESLMDQIAAMQHEVESLNRKKRELIEQINTIQVERLNDDKSRLREAQKRVMESQAMVNSLEMQIDSLNKQKNEMEVILKKTSEENCQLKVKMKELEKKIYDLERNLVQSSDRVSVLEREANELSTKLSLRDEEFNSLQSQMLQLEHKMTRGREDEATEQKNNSLAKEREEKLNYGISSKEFEKIRGWFKGSKPSLQVIERKMEELVEEFRKHMEDNIRLMSQRIRVTEQLHVENKENYKITKERLEQENRTLEARTSEYSRMLSTLDSATMRLKNVAEATHNMLSTLDVVCKQFDERSGRMMNRMSNISDELRYVRNWVIETKKVNELLKGEMGALVEQLQRKEEKKSLLREKISILLESKVENISLVKALEQVEQNMRGLQAKVREKENGILDICEEKREAIRQLCVLIDYQRNRCDHFREIITQRHTVISPRKC